MKKLMIALAFVAFTSTAFTQSASHDPMKEVQYAIAQQVTFPKTLKQSDFNESVAATVKLHPAGKLEVMHVETTNPSLRDYIVESLEKITVPSDMVFKAITLSLNFNFKVL